MPLARSRARFEGPPAQTLRQGRKAQEMLSWLVEAAPLAWQPAQPFSRASGVWCMAVAVTAHALAISAGSIIWSNMCGAAELL